MDAMILAAGLGTRLRPHTEDTPKALIEVGGVTMLERVARQLEEAGADRVIINAHHFPEQIQSFVDAELMKLRADFLLSVEPDAPLGTGGGLANAGPLFLADEPFFLHNIDIITDFDLEAMYAAHEESGALVTLAVNQRDTQRFFLFDEQGFYGRDNEISGKKEIVREPVGDTLRIAFAGVHVISPDLLDLITEQGTFDIGSLYVRLAGEGHRILPYDMTEAMWLEMGNPERLEAARSIVAEVG